MLRIVLIVASALALSAHAEPRTPDARSLERAVAQGHDIAERRCGTCHAVRRGGVSPRPSAPPFGSLQMRHTAGLDGRVAKLTREGHYGMPPIDLRPDELRALLLYMDSLDRP